MKTYSMRRMYGETLVELGACNPDVVVLEADLATATKTCLFRERFPERFFEVGIAEQNMASMAAGLALCGKIPFMTGLAVFVTMRACEQVRTSVALARANVKIVGAYGGLCTAENGPTHQCVADLGVVRAIPGMTVIAPADAASCRAMVFAMARYQGPVYMRILRDREPVLYDTETAAALEIGKGHRLVEGEDVTLMAHGLMVSVCLGAGELLASQGISASVVDMYSVKPIDAELVLEEARRTGVIVTVEEHNVIGGLGSAVAEVVAREQSAALLPLGLNDSFATSGRHADLLERFGLTAEQVADAAESMVAKVNDKRGYTEIS